MERRDFLRVGAFAGAGAVGTGCTAGLDLSATSGGAVETFSVEQMNAFLKNLDATSTRIDQEAIAPRMAPAGVVNRFNPDDFGDAKNERLFRKSLKSLTIASSFQSLSTEDQAHPGVQSRMWAGMGDMDDSIRGMNAMLENLTVTEREDLRRAMRDDPGLADRFVEDLDQRATEAKLSLTTRMQLRKTALHAVARMKQSPGLVIDEYTEKCKKTIERSGSNEEIFRRASARMGEEATNAIREKMTQAHERWKVALGDPIVVTDGTPQPPPSPSSAANGPVSSGQPQQGFAEPPKSNSEGLVTAGAVLLGLSAVTTGVGIALVFTTGIPGMITLTVAGVLLIVGLIILIVGLVRRGS